MSAPLLSSIVGPAAFPRELARPPPNWRWREHPHFGGLLAKSALLTMQRVSDVALVAQLTLEKPTGFVVRVALQTAGIVFSTLVLAYTLASHRSNAHCGRPHGGLVGLLAGLFQITALAEMLDKLLWPDRAEAVAEGSASGDRVDERAAGGDFADDEERRVAGDATNAPLEGRDGGESLVVGVDTDDSSSSELSDGSGDAGTPDGRDGEGGVVLASGAAPRRVSRAGGALRNSPVTVVRLGGVGSPSAPLWPPPAPALRRDPVLVQQSRDGADFASSVASVLASEVDPDESSLSLAVDDSEATAPGVVANCAANANRTASPEDSDYVGAGVRSGFRGGPRAALALRGARGRLARNLRSRKHPINDPIPKGSPGEYCRFRIS